MVGCPWFLKQWKLFLFNYLIWSFNIYDVFNALIMLICIGMKSLHANLCFIFGKASNTILRLLVYHMSIFRYLFRAVITKDSEIWLEKQFIIKLIWLNWLKRIFIYIILIRIRFGNWLLNKSHEKAILRI